MARETADQWLKRDAPQRIELREKGSAPRRALVAAVTSSDRQAVSLSLAIEGSEAQDDGSRLPLEAVLDIRFAARAGGLSMDQGFRQIRLGRGCTTEQSEQLAEPLGEVSKARSIWYFDRWGRTERTDLRLPKSTSIAALEMLATVMPLMGELIVPAPQEAVGRGARWTVLSRRDHADIEMIRFADYTVESMDRHHVTIGVSIHDAGIAPEPSKPLSVGVLSAASGEGSGRFELDGQHLVRRGELKLTTSIRTEPADGQGSVAFTSSQKVELIRQDTDEQKERPSSTPETASPPPEPSSAKP